MAKNGIVKLTDFGVAHVFAGDQLTATGGVIGTVEYMSPSRLKENASTSAATSTRSAR